MHQMLRSGYSNRYLVLAPQLSGELDLARLDLAQLDLPRLDLPRLDLARLDLARLDLPRPDLPQTHPENKSLTRVSHTQHGFKISYPSVTLIINQTN